MQSYSKHEKTNNLAIDMVAEAVGQAKKMKRPIENIVLSRQFYALFWAGVEILMQKPAENDTEFYYEGVLIKQGSPMMIDRIKVNYKVKLTQMKKNN